MRELRGFFCEDLRACLIDVTPVVPSINWDQYDEGELPEQYLRQEEVLAWLDREGLRDEPWAALHDQPWLFSPACDRLVVCDGNHGVTLRELDQVADVLNRQR
jgi:hypothetical protein